MPRANALWIATLMLLVGCSERAPTVRGASTLSPSAPVVGAAPTLSPSAPVSVPPTPTATPLDCAWRLERAPNSGEGDGTFEAVSATGGRAWAVGSASGRAFAARWDGSAWRAASSGLRGGSLEGVHARARNDVWAVGSIGDDTLAVRWNGTRWRVVSRIRDGASATLSAVAATSSRSVWAVGLRNTDGVHDRTVIERWDGARWRRVRSPNPGRVRNRLNAIATARGAVWAGGVAAHEVDVGAPLILRLRGSTWRAERVPTPRGATWAEIEGMHARAPDDVWAVGSFWDARGAHAMALRYDGARWRLLDVPDAGATGARTFGPPYGPHLAGVVAVARDEVWAVGTFNEEVDASELRERTLVVRWDGRAWTRVPSPNNGDGANALRGVTAAGGTVAHAVGLGGADQTRTLAMRFAC